MKKRKKKRRREEEKNEYRWIGKDRMDREAKGFTPACLNNRL